MVNVLFISLSSLDNDSRILKSIDSLQKYDYKIETLSKDTSKVFEVKNFNIKYKAKRYFGIPKLGIFFLWYEIFKLLFSLDLVKYNIVHCNDLNTLPIGVIIKKFFNKNVKIVYDAHEYEINDAPNESAYKIKLKYYLEKFLIKHADKVITVSDAIADEYVRLYNIPKPALVLNTPLYKKITEKDIFRETLNISKDKTIFLYQGGLSSGRGIEILLDTFKLMDDKSVIVFMGYGELEKEIQEMSKKYNNIYFHQAVSPDILLDYTNSADFGILFYENNCLNHYYCSPNKMFEYLMAEIPVIVSNLYEIKRLVENNKIGVVSKENTLQGLKDAIEEAVKLDKEKLKTNIQKVKEIYNWKEQEKVLLTVYKGLN